MPTSIRRRSRPILAAGLLLAAILAFAFIARDIGSPRLTDADLRIAQWVRAHESPALTRAMRATTTLGAPSVVLTLAAIAAAVLATRGRYRLTLAMVVCVGGGLLFNYGLKHFFERARPDLFPPLAHARGHSFPSGHTVGATLLYGLMAILGAPRLPHLSLRIVASLAAITLIALIAFSRVYLSVHHLSDVLAAIAVGAAWLILGLSAFTAIPGRPRPVPRAHVPARSIGIVLNPRSGASRSTPARIRRLLHARGLTATIVAAAHPAQVPGLTRDLAARGHDLIVAAGGDGTISAVASVLAGTQTTLGILPLGTLNHLARDLGIPLNLHDAVRTLAIGSPTPIDVGDVNGHTFVNNVSLGLYPAFVQARGRTRWAGTPGRLAAALSLWRRIPLVRARITVDGATLRRCTPIVVVGNNPYVLRGPRLGRRPGIDTGRLCLVTTRRRRPWGLVCMWLRALPGTGSRTRRTKDLELRTGTEVLVQTGADRAPVAVDGEVLEMDLPLRCTIRPGALRVLFPHHPGRPVEGRSG